MSTNSEIIPFYIRDFRIYGFGMSRVLEFTQSKSQSSFLEFINLNLCNTDCSDHFIYSCLHPPDYFINLWLHFNLTKSLIRVFHSLTTASNSASLLDQPLLFSFNAQVEKRLHLNKPFHDHCSREGRKRSRKFSAGSSSFTCKWCKSAYVLRANASHIATFNFT